MMLNGNRTKSNRGRSPRDLYITPPELAKAAMKIFASDEYENIPIAVGLDAGCGTGVWAESALRYVDVIHGIDLVPNMRFGTNFTGDFLKFSNDGYSLVFGNPPYSLAEEFIRHSLYELLEPNGYVYFLLRLSFLEGIARGKGLFKEFPIKRVYVCSRRPSFFSTNGKHTTDTLAYAMFLWQKGYTGKTELSFLDWEYKNEN